MHKDEPEYIAAELDNIITAAELAKSKSSLAIVKQLVLDADYFAARGHSTRSFTLLKKAIEIQK